VMSRANKWFANPEHDPPALREANGVAQAFVAVPKERRMEEKLSDKIVADS